MKDEYNKIIISLLNDKIKEFQKNYEYTFHSGPEKIPALQEFDYDDQSDKYYLNSYDYDKLNSQEENLKSDNARKIEKLKEIKNYLIKGE